MKIILNFLTASVLVQTAFCASVGLTSHEDTKKLTATSVELLSSFRNCIVYIYNWPWKKEYDSFESTRYVQFYSEYISCAVLVETDRQYRRSTYNKRLDKIEPHPIFTKYTTTLLNLITPHTTTSNVRKVNVILRIFRVVFFYNIPFKYILMFMRNEDFSPIHNDCPFCMLATISSPAVYLLILDEKEVSVIGFAHVFQAAPFLFKVTKFQEAHIQQLHELIHKDLQRAISRVWFAGTSWEKCTFGGTIVSIDPPHCTLDLISENFNITLLNDKDHPDPKLSITDIAVNNKITSIFMKSLSRYQDLNFYFVSYAVVYQEYNFLCIAQVHTVGFMAFVQAFDLLTWIVAATACVCLSAAMALMDTKAMTSFWTKFQLSTPVVVMLLIERFYGYGQVIRSASRQIGLVITLWAEYVSAYGMWSTTQSRKLRVLRGGTLPFFNDAVPLFVQSNFLGPILQRFLGKVCQCGMWKYWTDSTYNWNVNHIFKRFVQVQQVESGIELVRKSNLAIIWQNFSPELVVGEAELSVMTLENMNAVFQVFGICMLLALCVFIKERRIIQLVGHCLFQMAKNVLNSIVDDFLMLLRRVVNRATVTVHPDYN